MLLAVADEKSVFTKTSLASETWSSWHDKVVREKPFE
jgi:hypothetical protein